MFQVGATHTIAINNKNKVYSWGWNDQGQCGEDTDEVEVKEIVSGQYASKCLHMNLDHSIGRVKQLIAGEDHSILLDSHGNVYSWGNNAKGQLGFGHYENEWKPSRITELPEGEIRQITACGNQNLATTTSGGIYIWPCMKDGKKISIPQSIPFNTKKIKIEKVSCGYNFGVLLTNQGLLYTFGKSNNEGQLGHGDQIARGIPELVTCLKDAGEKIDTVVCGFRHVIAKSTLGKVFTWGWGSKGQLGHGDYTSQLSPSPLHLEKKKQKIKVV